MLDHKIVLESGRCRLRPMTDADEAAVVRLWNQDFVVGKLFMSRTTPEVYREHFERYKTDPDQYRWVVEDRDGKFIGTSGVTRVEQFVFKIGFLALYPTDSFQPVEPGILVRDYVFSPDGFNAKKMIFTIVTTNHAIRRMHRLFRDIDTGRRIEKIGSNGEPVTLECWEITPESWASARPTMTRLFLN